MERHAGGRLFGKLMGLLRFSFWPPYNSPVPAWLRGGDQQGDGQSGFPPVSEPNPVSFDPDPLPHDPA
jgi:hypothetical protein